MKFSMIMSALTPYADVSLSASIRGAEKGARGFALSTDPDREACSGMLGHFVCAYWYENGNPLTKAAVLFPIVASLFYEGP